ncbi:metallophosphoesterase [Ferrovibrio sp.]|uniref:metallophosphoesterase n=1 Tax=Ferrovibrio sp. TaxID=1917215 RepID=UPI001B6C0F36|nr:metallophosphoesterase [Ferrovibrio sp.]MBP7064871.1 serine/threonine protein phosphatase [Ferrovibrio sp.]
MVLKWFTGRLRPNPVQALAQPAGWTPEGTRIYAIGDIHGRADLLARMYQAIADDVAENAPASNVHVVLLGDLVDRGLHSRAVVELAMQPPLALPGLTHTVLMGNHEQLLLDFHADGRGAELWLEQGGMATLASYDCQLPMGSLSKQQAARLHIEFRERLPQRHALFLAQCPKQLLLGDYLFVHAGIRPGRPLDRQTDTDRLWIREPFLNNPGPFEKIVVHGHNITSQPDQHPHRIGIDTGAYATGILSAVILEQNTCRFLQVN